MQTKCIILTEKGRKGKVCKKGDSNMKNKARLGVIEIKKGKILQSQVLDFNMEEYYVILLQPDDRIYNRAKIKQETQNAIDKYFQGGEKWEER